ncbi:MAG: hypothetical protein K0Q93_1199 [Nocardioidaceae bacterium]|nr:hypothetical protein [Nocardioidaceae bacterium]
MNALAAAAESPSSPGPGATTVASPPPLEDGWQPTTPPGDTLTRQYVDNHAAYLEAVAGAGGGRFRRTSWYAAADLGRPATVLNATLLLHPDSLRDPAATLSELDGFYSTGVGTVYLWSPWPTPDLQRYGWQLEGHPPLMLRPPDGRLPGASDVSIERVADAAAVRRWESVVVEGYPFPDVQPSLPGALLDPRILDDDRLRLWLAYDRGEPVTAGGLFVDCGIAHFSFGVTLPMARRRGHWYALVRERLLSAPGLPAAGLFTDASRPGAERVGFLPVSRFTLWSRPR